MVVVMSLLQGVLFWVGHGCTVVIRITGVRLWRAVSFGVMGMRRLIGIGVHGCIVSGVFVAPPRAVLMRLLSHTVLTAS